VTGSVSKVDQNSITLDQGVTLTVDSQTQVLRRGQPVAAGIAAIREGTQVRASFDPASNRADKIEVMSSKKSKKSKSSAMGSGSSSGSTGSVSGSAGSTGSQGDRTTPDSKSNTGTSDQNNPNPK
jgi:hypothetical protein